MTRRATLSAVLRIGISIGLVALVLTFVEVDPQAIWALLRQINPLWAAAGLALMLIQLGLTALRWFFVNQALEIDIPPTACLRLMCVGQFFNQCLPTSVGGDAVKIGLLVRGFALPLKTAAFSVFVDRLVGLVILLGVACLGWAIFGRLWPDPVPQQATVTVLLGVMVSGVLGGVFVAMPLLARNRQAWSRISGLRTMAEASNRLALRWPHTAIITGASVLVQGLIATSVYVGSHALGVPLPAIALALLPLILLVSSLPFSFAGWGLREGAMVTGLSLIGVTSAEAISISILHGLAQLAISLPGAVIIVARSRIPAPKSRS